MTVSGGLDKLTSGLDCVAEVKPIMGEKIELIYESLVQERI